MRILKLDVAGRPVAWMTREDSAILYCRKRVAWEAGAENIILRGGYSRCTGLRSELRMNSIVATTAISKRADLWAGTPALSNARLFRRDGYMCLYCGDRLSARMLTRDHVIPLSAGGEDIWENVVSACRSCNHRKDNHSLKEIGMRLLAVPYAPNRAEGLILENRNILADQLAFLHTYIGSRSRLRSH